MVLLSRWQDTSYYTRFLREIHPRMSVRPRDSRQRGENRPLRWLAMALSATARTGDVREGGATGLPREDLAITGDLA